MSKILKYFCCSIWFVILNLCGSSAVDYLTFNNYKPFECSKCRKQVSGSLDMLKQQGGAFNIALDEINSYNSLSSVIDLPSINVPNVYLAAVRSDNRNFLMCSDCLSEDISEQIRLLVKEFCPGFNFSNPKQRDIDDLSQNNSFIQRIPGIYRCNVKGSENGRFDCYICCSEGDSEEDKIDVFETDDYVFCANCGNLFHTECIEDWLKKSFNCPVCSFTALFKKANDDLKKSNFRTWAINGCSCIKFSDVIKNAKDMRYLQKYSDGLIRYRNNDVPDEFLKALLPGRAVTESKCARFCNCIRSFFGC